MRILWISLKMQKKYILIILQVLTLWIEMVN